MDGWGRLITEAREAAGLTKAELARRTGIDASLLSRYEYEKVDKLTQEAFNLLVRELPTLSSIDLLRALGWSIRGVTAAGTVGDQHTTTKSTFHMFNVDGQWRWVLEDPATCK